MKVATVAVAAALALGMGACGGDDDDDGGGGGGATTNAQTTPASGDALSKEEFVAKANEICSDAQEEASKIESPSQGNFDELEETLVQSKEIAEAQQSKLEALTPPDELKSQVDELNRLSRENLAKLDETLEAARAKDATKVQEVLQSVDTSRIEELSKEIGADKCAG